MSFFHRYLYKDYILYRMIHLHGNSVYFNEIIEMCEMPLRYKQYPLRVILQVSFEGPHGVSVIKVSYESSEKLR